LRRGFFLGTLIDEAYGAVKEIIRLYSPDRGAGLAGFSMGANFCIRIARMASIGKSGLVRFISQPNGGHCGYIMNSRLESWSLPLMLRAFTL